MSDPLLEQWFQEPAADRPRFVAGQRLDLVDALALGRISLDAGARDLGALMGDTEGCLSPPVATIGTDGAGSFWVTVSPFQYLWSHASRDADGSIVADAGDTYWSDGHIKARRAKVITFDPEADSQDAQVDITGYVAAIQAVYDAQGQIPKDDKNYPYLWARPYLLATDGDSRRRWDAGAGQEEVFDAKTRFRVRTELLFDSQRPGPQEGDVDKARWVCVGRVVRWDILPLVSDKPAVPLLLPLSVFDSWEMHQFVRDLGGPTFGGDAGVMGVQAGDSGQEARYGRAPWPGPTSNVSGFFGALPPFDADEGLLLSAGHVNGGRAAPTHLGLPQVLHLIRDRIRRLLVGQTPAFANHPWWESPARGLLEVGQESAANALGLAALASRVEDVRDELLAFVGGEQAPGLGPQMLAWFEVQASPEGSPVNPVGLNYQGLPLQVLADGNGDQVGYAVRLTVPFDQVGSVDVYEVATGNTFGVVTGNYNPSKGGFRAKYLGKNPWDTSQGQLTSISVLLEGPDHTAGDGTHIFVSGAFGLRVWSKS